MSLKREMKIDKDTGFVVIPHGDNETASVLIINKDRAVRVDAIVWAETDWEQYISRRIEASQRGHSLSMSLMENEK